MPVCDQTKIGFVAESGNAGKREIGYSFCGSEMP